MKHLGSFFLLAALLLVPGALAQNAPSPAPMTPAEKQFQEALDNVALVGYFTRGDQADLHEDRYVIERVTKVQDDVWKFEARSSMRLSP